MFQLLSADIGQRRVIRTYILPLQSHNTKHLYTIIKHTNTNIMLKFYNVKIFLNLYDESLTLANYIKKTGYECIGTNISMF